MAKIFDEDGKKEHEISFPDRLEALVNSADSKYIIPEGRGENPVEQYGLHFAFSASFTYEVYVVLD